MPRPHPAFHSKTERPTEAFPGRKSAFAAVGTALVATVMVGTRRIRVLDAKASTDRSPQADSDSFGVCWWMARNLRARMGVFRLVADMARLPSMVTALEFLRGQGSVFVTHRMPGCTLTTEFACFQSGHVVYDFEFRVVNSEHDRLPGMLYCSRPGRTRCGCFGVCSRRQRSIPTGISTTVSTFRY